MRRREAGQSPAYGSMTVGFNENREEFETRIHLAPTHISLPCSCEDGSGPEPEAGLCPWHWAAIRLDEVAILEHFRLEVCLAELREAERV